MNTDTVPCRKACRCIGPGLFRCTFLLLVLLLSLLPVSAAVAKPGDLDPNFLEPNPTGTGPVGHVYAGASVVQPDGKIIVGGTFTSFTGQQRYKIVRLNADGSLDDAFAKYMVLDYGVSALALLPDGKILVGGSFYTIGSSTPVNHIIRLNSDGTRDTTFQSQIVVVTGTNATMVTVIVPLADGDLLVGGRFSSVGGVARGNIARLNADGSLDAAWMDGVAETGTNGIVNAMLVQPDGMILISGQFTQVNNTPCGRLARLEPHGSLDNSFLYTAEPGANGMVLALALQIDGKVLAGGDFTTMNGTARPYLARLNRNGTVDTSFQPEFGLPDYVQIRSINWLGDDDLLVTGSFSKANGADRANIVRLNADGTNDASFHANNTGTDRSITRALIQPDGKMILTGTFTRVNGMNRNMVARLNANGTLDTNFLIAGANHEVNAVAVQPADGMVLIGGRFNVVNGLKQSGIARLNPDGTVDTQFTSASGGGVSGGGGRVNTIALQPDGGILVGGNFTKAGHRDAGNFARFDQYGNPDATFDTGGAKGADGEVYGIALQPDGKILVVGSFLNAGEAARKYVARFNANGTLDTAFVPVDIDKMVYAVAVQPDGKIIIAGEFGTVGGQPRGRVARLNADGTLDEGYLNGVTGAQNVVRTVDLDPQGNAIIGGWFTSVNGVPYNRIARLSVTDGSPDPDFLKDLTGPDNGIRTLEVQPSGAIVIGGEFFQVNGTPCKQLAMLNPNGSLNSSFNCQGATGFGNQGWLNDLEMYRGRIIIGGDFTKVQGQERGRVAVMDGSNRIYLPAMVK